MSSVCEAGGSDSNELKICPPPSPVVLCFVDGREMVVILKNRLTYPNKNSKIIFPCISFLKN